MGSIARVLFIWLFPLVLMFSGLRARAEILLNTSAEEVMSKGLAVVEVLGKAKGSGILVLLDDKPVVLTNSHNLRGLTTAQVFLPKRLQRIYDSSNSYSSKTLNFSFKRVGVVIVDHPAIDFSFLALPEEADSATREIIRAYAKASGQFCYRNVSCKEEWLPTQGTSSILSVAAVIDGNIALHEISPKTKINQANGYSIFPFYGRPGVSGGAFYKNGKLEGMLTKISLSGTPEILAIPISKIASELKAPTLKGRWDNETLIIDRDQDTIRIQPSGNGGGESGNGGGESGNGGGESGNGGGESGNGGGESGNGGGESGNGGGDLLQSKYLRLEVLSHNELFLTQTWNPFLSRSGRFQFNDRFVSFVRQDDNFVLPRLDLFLKSQKDLQLLGADNIQDLLVLRQKKLKNLTTVRVYEKDSRSGIYRVLAPEILKDGSSPLAPGNNQFWRKYIKSRNFPMPKLLESGYYRHFEFPLHAKISSDSIFDIIVGEIRISGPRDLSKVTILKDGITYSLPAKASSAGQVAFADLGLGVRIVYHFQTQDLTQIEKVFLSVDDFLIEVWSD